MRNRNRIQNRQISVTYNYACVLLVTWIIQIHIRNRCHNPLNCLESALEWRLVIWLRLWWIWNRVWCIVPKLFSICHYDDVRMGAIASQITSLTIVYSTVNSDAYQRNIKDPRHWPLCGEFTGTGEFPAQRASYAENVFIWWRHHVDFHRIRHTDIINIDMI